MTTALTSSVACPLLNHLFLITAICVGANMTPLWWKQGVRNKIAPSESERHFEKTNLNTVCQSQNQQIGDDNSSQSSVTVSVYYTWIILASRFASTRTRTRKSKYVLWLDITKLGTRKSRPSIRTRIHKIWTRESIIFGFEFTNIGLETLIFITTTWIRKSRTQ